MKRCASPSDEDGEKHAKAMAVSCNGEVPANGNDPVSSTPYIYYETF